MNNGHGVYVVIVEKKVVKTQIIDRGEQTIGGGRKARVNLPRVCGQTTMGDEPGGCRWPLFAKSGNSTTK